MYSCPFCDQELSTEVERDRHIVDKHPEMLTPTARDVERMTRITSASNRVRTAAETAAHLTYTFLSVRASTGLLHTLSLEEVMETFKWFYGTLFTSLGG